MGLNIKKMTKKRNDYVMQPILDALKPLEGLTDPRTSVPTHTIGLTSVQLDIMMEVIRDWQNGRSINTVIHMYPDVPDMVNKVGAIFLKERNNS